MFNLIFGRRKLPNFRAFLEFASFSSSHYVCSLPSSPTNFSAKHSLTVSYLINSCGLSPEKALSVSKRVRIESAEKCDSVLAIFKNNGFTKIQISSLIRISPRLLLCNPDKSVLPKLEFFRSIGLSSTEYAKMISTSPTILNSSLEKKIIPTFKYYNDLFKSKEKVVFAFKRYPMLVYRPTRYATNNIQILREVGVPYSNAVDLLQCQPRSFFTDASDFRRIVEEVKEMGFDPLRKNFVIAVHTFRSVNKSTWEKKVQVYNKWGLSKDEVLVTFGKYPNSMRVSEDKITRLMQFVVNRLGLKPCVIVDMPVLLTLSLERRLYPRALIIQVLLEKGLIKKNASFLHFFRYSENDFLNKILKKCEDEAPEGLKLYKKAE